MKAVIQRVNKGSVSVNGKVINSINKGYVILLGVKKDDVKKDAQYISKKILEIRLFPDNDKEGVFNILDIKGEILLISQFTLYADTRKGRRPSFSDAKKSDEANKMYEDVADILTDGGVVVKKGVFGAMMDVELINNGPYTIIIDSKI